MTGTQPVAIKEFALGFYDGPHATPKEADDGPIFLGIKNVSPEGRLDLSEIRHVSEEEFPRWTRRVLPKKDDLVFSYEATLHRYARIPEGFRGCLGRRMALVRPDPRKVDPRFLHYYFLSATWRAKMEAITIVGATVPRIPLTLVPNTIVRLPPLDEQERIADILSAYDDLIENNRRRIKLLEEVARQLYREWFVRLRFPGHEHTKIVDGVPEGWERKCFDDVCQTIGGGTPSTKNPDFWTDGDVTWITPTDITRNNCLAVLDSEKKITQSGLKGSSAKMLPPLTILMTSRASVGFFGIADFEVCTNQGFINIVPHDECARYFLLFNLMHRVEEIRGHASGSTYAEISKSKFRGLPVLMPSDKLMLTFDDEVRLMLDQVRILKKQSEASAKARDVLLPRLMDGRIAV